MKQGKKPTRVQKNLLSIAGYNPAEWLVERDLVNVTVFVSRSGENRLVLEK